MAAPDKTIQHPNKPEHPAHSGVAAQAAPVEEHAEPEVLPGGQRGEEDEHYGAAVVGCLQQHNLREDLARRDISESARARWPPPPLTQHSARTIKVSGGSPASFSIDSIRRCVAIGKR